MGNIFLNTIAENKIELKICELASSVKVKIKNPKIIEKTSQSPSEVIFAKLVSGETDINVSIKLFLDINKLNLSPDKLSLLSVETIPTSIIGLQYEACLYKYITDKIINRFTRLNGLVCTKRLEMLEYIRNYNSQDKI